MDFRNILSSMVQGVKDVANKTPLTPFASADKLSTGDAVKFGVGVLQSITRSGARLALGVKDIAEGQRESSALEIDPTASKLEKTFFKAMFGTSRVSGFAEAVAQKEIEYPELKKRGLVVPIAIAATTMDFTGFGGGKKGLIKLLTDTTDPVMVRRLLQKAGIADDLISNYAEAFARAKNADEVKQGLDALEGMVKATKKALGVGGDKAGKEAVQQGIEEAPSLLRQLPEQQIARKIPVDDLSPGESVVDIARKTFKERVSQITQGVKERGFITSMKEADSIPAQTKELIEQLPTDKKFYEIYTDDAAIKKATDLIGKSHDEALSYVLSSTHADKDVVTTGMELMRRYRVAGNHKMEAEIAGNLAEKATRAGQGVQAFSILNKLSPEGILVFAAKRLGKAPSVPLAKKIIKQAEELENLPFGYGKYKKTQELIETIATEAPMKSKAWDLIQELANLPRAIMSSFFDFSGTLRQGLVSGIRHPMDFADAFKSQFKAFGSEAGYDEIMDSIIKNPEFQNAVDSGVRFADINTKLSGREERYMSSLLERIPGIGILPRATNRSYTALLNKMRMDNFVSLKKSHEAMGIEFKGEVAQNISSLINDMTGRGDLPQWAEKMQTVLNAFFFSPRLIASRVNLINPIGLGKGYLLQSAPVRKEYLKTMLAYGTAMTTIMGLSKAAGLEVGVDPRNADFGKVKIGNTRIDFAGGFQQYLRMGAQLISGKYVSSTTGKVITLGEGYKPLTRWDILTRQVESKEAPIFSFITDWLKQQTPAGEDFSVLKGLQERFTPMLISDLMDVYKDDPSMLPLGILSTFGVGLQTYGPPEAYVKLEELRNAEDPGAEFAKLKKENPSLAQKVERAGIESTFNEFDWGLTYMGVENGKRARFLVEHFSKLETDEERTALWTDLMNKKLLSKNVAEQINYFWSNPDAINKYDNK